MRGLPVACLPSVLILIATGAQAFGQHVRNQLQNSSFEQDWIISEALAKRRWGLIARAEAGHGAADGKIDHWEVPVAWWSKRPYMGLRAVKLTAGRKLTQSVRVAMRSPKGGNPASQHTDFRPLDPRDSAKLEPRVLRGGAWIRAEGVPEGQVKVTIAAGSETAEAAIPAGTYTWRRIEVVSPKPWPAARSMSITISCAGGTIWVDDAFLAEDALGQNLAVNGDMEALDAEGWLKGYSQPEAFWWFRFDYYSWTGWSHDGGYGCQLAERIDLVPGYRWRGHAAADSLVSHSGRRSLRLVAYPGDNFGVLGPAIAIDGTKPFEIGAWAKADRVHHVELMAVDADRNRYILMDTDHFAGLEGVGVNAGSKGQGTYHWTYLRKLVCPKEPVKRIRPMVAVRGFDGRIIEKNHVGTVWFDDLEVIPRAGSTPTPSPPPPADDEVRIGELDLGDRLWGQNEIRIGLRNTRNTPVQLRLAIASPGQDLAPMAELSVSQSMITQIGYEVDTLCASWQDQYQLELSVTAGEKTRSLRTAFGTPSSLLSTRVSHYYLFPNERLVVAANVNAASLSLDKLSQVLLQVTDPDGKVVAQTAVDEPATKLPIIVPESRALVYLDRDRCITMAPPLDRCKVRPWAEATRDYTVTVRLIGRDGKEMATAKGGQFGRITPFGPSQIDFQGPFSVNSEHFLLCNGKPVFPVYFGEYGDTFRPEEGVNITRADVANLGANPHRLKPDEMSKFGMTRNFGCGEWDLNGLLNLEPEDVAKGIAKLRAANPGKLIVGGYDLISHPGSRRADVARYLLPAYDIVCMEGSFSSYVPNVKVDYFPAMQGKNCAIFVGFEHYYFVPYEELRYRSYLSVMRGAAGLGLIPSRMMMGQPEQNNYLRGLNAECRSLAPIFAAPPAKTPTAVSQPCLFTWEKQRDGKRYLFVVRGEPFLTRGLFRWAERQSPSGARAHTEPRAAGLTQHWVENTKPYAVGRGDTIVQELCLEGAAPRMVALQFRTRTNVDHTWEHRAYWGKADLERFVAEATYPADHRPPKPWPAWMVVEDPPQTINAASERGAYYFEVLGGAACKAVDGQPSLRRLGDLPKTGQWVTVRIPAKEVGLEGQRLDGIAFAVDGGQVYWGKTSLVSGAGAGAETVLIDGSLEGLSVDSGAWPVKFTVPNATSIKVRALFENVSLEVDGNVFTDCYTVPYRARVYEIEAR